MNTGIRSPVLMFLGRRVELLQIFEQGRAWVKAVFLKDSLIFGVKWFE